MTASSVITDYIAVGLAASRPATPSLATGAFGLYYATDTGVLSIWTGAAWVSAGLGTPAVTLISESTPSATGTVTFNSIAATYRDLMVVVRGRGDQVATSTQVLLRLNNDSASNYDQQSSDVSNTTQTNFATAGSATTSAGIGYVPAASATSGMAGYIEARIFDYRGTTYQKQGAFRGATKTSNAAAGQFKSEGQFAWRSASAVTRVDVILTSGNFVAGSVVSLYGLL